MSAPNPVAATHTAPPPGVSTQTYNIAGISVTVYGQAELASRGATSTAVLWLLHPRLQAASSMAPLASAFVHGWNEGSHAPSLGLVAVSFDQRNHGSRLVTALANEAWRDGNATHAQDMFGHFSGTARDTQHLLELLAAYAFPPPSPVRVVHHAALGVSLGGHCAWHALLHSPQVRSAVAVIGCPDYATLMADRARLSKRPSFVGSSPPGKAFFGGPDFPPALVDAILRLDPRGLLTGTLPKAEQTAEERIELDKDQELRAARLVRERLAHKKLLCLSGGADKLVPYAKARPFMDWFKKGLQPGAWADGNGFELKDVIFDGVGHNMPPSMVAEAKRFLFADLEQVASGLEKRSRI